MNKIEVWDVYDKIIPEWSNNIADLPSDERVIKTSTLADRIFDKIDLGQGLIFETSFLANREIFGQNEDFFSINQVTLQIKKIKKSVSIFWTIERLDNHSSSTIETTVEKADAICLLTFQLLLHKKYYSEILRNFHRNFFFAPFGIQLTNEMLKNKAHAEIWSLFRHLHNFEYRQKLVLLTSYIHYASHPEATDEFINEAHKRGISFKKDSAKPKAVWNFLIAQRKFRKILKLENPPQINWITRKREGPIH